MAKVGIDYGTSNSSVIWHHNNRDMLNQSSFPMLSDKKCENCQ